MLLHLFCFIFQKTWEGRRTKEKEKEGEGEKATLVCQLHVSRVPPRLSVSLLIVELIGEEAFCLS